MYVVPASESKTADSTSSLAQMVQDRLMCSESDREGEEWRDRLQPLGEDYCMHSTFPPWLAGNASKSESMSNRCPGVAAIMTQVAVISSVQGWGLAVRGRA